jgi:hypothetical protein
MQQEKMKMKVVCMVFLFLCSCNATKTSYDYDLLIDFSKFRTYDFSERSLVYGRQISGSTFLAAVGKEMARRGFKKSKDPDVLIDLFVFQEQKEKETVTTHDQSNPWAPGYSTGFKVRTTSIDEYTEGTIFISMLHEQQKKIVWQARTTGVLKQKKSEVRTKRIHKAVAKMFETYPFRTNNY